MIDPPALVPELDGADLAVSIKVYRQVFGFALRAERPEEAFAYLAMGRAHLMMQQADGPGRRFRTAALERPFGRGISLQILVANALVIYERVAEAGLEIVLPLEERWYRQNSVERGHRQFVVADPDGYLLRFFDDLGPRPAEY